MAYMIASHAIQTAALPYGVSVLLKPAPSLQSNMPFNERIKTAMTMRGLDPTPAALQKAWKAHFGAKHPVSRQVFYDWFKAKTPKISPANLFCLSDILNVNSRWLCGWQHPVFGRVDKPFHADEDMKRLLDAYEALRPGFKEELIQQANKLLALQNEASAAYPFKPKV